MQTHAPQEPRFQEAAGAAPALLWISDPTGFCTFLSQGWYLYTGQTEESGLGYGWLEAIHPDDQQHTRDTYFAGYATRSAFQLDYRLRRHDGQYRWAIDSGRPYFSDTGEFLGYVGSVIDIHERKMAEVALRESEGKYRSLFNSMDQGFCICEMLVDKANRPFDYRFLEVNTLFEEHTGLKAAEGRTALELVPNLEAHWIEIYGKVALTGEPLRFVQGSEVMGRWFDVYAFRLEPAHSRKFAILFTDITARRRAEEYSRILQTIAASLSSALTQQEVIDIFINQAVSRLGAVAGSIVVLDEYQTRLEIIGTHGYSDEVVEKWRYIPLDHPTALIAIAVRDGTPLWLRTPGDREALAPMTSNLSSEEQHQAWAILPFNIRDHFIGAIGLGFGSARTFDEAEQSFFLTLTDYCAQALDRARLTEQARAVAAFEERQRLARDLHDAVSQVLFASASISESLPRIWERDSQKGMAYLQNVVTLNRGALAEMRKLLLELRPEAIVRAPFGELLTHLARALEAQKEIRVELHLDIEGDGLFPPDAHVAFYRISQEAINNVAKHSGAARLDIKCVYRDRNFRLVIEDNGRGFDPKRASMGIGMNSMRERAAAIGATVTIDGEVNRGTKLTIEWACA